MTEIPQHIIETASRAYVQRAHASINDRIVDALMASLLAASVDTHPKGEDVEQASFMGSAVPPAADAQKPIP